MSSEGASLGWMSSPRLSTAEHAPEKHTQQGSQSCFRFFAVSTGVLT